MRLLGRNAVIAGVGSAIGRACAVNFGREGARVLTVDPDEALAAEVSSEIRSEGGLAEHHAADLITEAAAEGVARRCGQLWEKLDVLVTCSGAIDFWSDEDGTIADWESILATNLLGPVAYTRQLLPMLKRSGAGAIIYLGSVDGILGNPNVPAYSVSKGGLIPLTHVMAWNYAPFNIRVNCIAAAGISQIGTGAKPRSSPTADQELQLQLTPLRRRATPEDIASVALFFASNDSAYVTGAVLPVDGGRTAITPGTARIDPSAS